MRVRASYGLSEELLRFFQERPHLPKQMYLAIQPVWITARVPADSKPGEYKGQLQLDISGQGAVRGQGVTVGAVAGVGAGVPLRVAVEDLAPEAGGGGAGRAGGRRPTR